MPDINTVNDNLVGEFKYTEEELAELDKLNALNENSDELKNLNGEDNLDDENFELDEETLTGLTQPNIDPKEDENLDPENKNNSPGVTEVPGGKSDTPAEQIPAENPPETEELEPLPDYTEQLEEIEQRRKEAQGNVDDTLAKLTDLAEQFDDGEIAQGKYDIEKQKLERQLKSFDAKLEKISGEHENLQAEADNKVSEHQAKSEAIWNQEVLAFLQDPANSLIAGNVNVANRFDEIMVSMGQSGVFNGLNNQQVLKTIRDRLALEVDLPAYTPASKTTTAKPKPDKPTQSTKNIPVSLSQTQSIEAPQDDPFAHIRKLSGVAYEDAIANLSPEQQDKFLFG